jgi:hypothetical protein
MFFFVFKDDDYSPLERFIYSIILSALYFTSIILCICKFILDMVWYRDINYLSIHRRTFFKMFPLNLFFPSIRTNQISMMMHDFLTQWVFLNMNVFYKRGKRLHISEEKYLLWSNFVVYSIDQRTKSKKE